MARFFAVEQNSSFYQLQPIVQDRHTATTMFVCWYVVFMKCWTLAIQKVKLFFSSVHRVSFQKSWDHQDVFVAKVRLAFVFFFCQQCFSP